MQAAATQESFAPQAGGAYQPQDVSFKAPTQDLTKPCFVFFAGQQIAPELITQNPQWALGGTLRPKSLALRYAAGYVRRCEITPLRTFIHADAKQQVHPDHRQYKQAVFNVEDDRGNVIQTLGIDAQGRHDGLLRTPFEASKELEYLTRQKDGLVAMPIGSAEQARRAQYFLFPEWDAYLAGEKVLPVKIKELEAYFKTRLEDTRGNRFFEAVARAAILSCASYYDWCVLVTKQVDKDLLRAEKEGFAWQPSRSRELAFEQAGIARRDRERQASADTMERMATAVTTIAEGFAKQQQAPAPAAAPEPVSDGLTEAERAELAELRAFREQKLEEERQALTTTDVAQCAGKTREGNRCKNKPEEGFDFCKIHMTPEGDTGAA